MTIITLWKQGKSKSAIAKLVGVSRRSVIKAVNNYEQTGATVVAPKSSNVSNIGLYKDKLIEYMEKGLSNLRIYEELVGAGMSVKYRTISRYIFQIRGTQNICVRFHTAPGEEAQVDFGYVGMLINQAGERKKAWVFNMRLSYSRLDYYEIVFDQQVKTFIGCHVNAFRKFCGVPKIVKIDNLKAGILEASFYEPTHQEMYRQFAEHYGFNPIPCRVYKPQEKGKVESGIKFVKNNFFAGRTFINSADAESRLADWVRIKCNSRIHGTTKRIPQELFEQEEKSLLSTLPLESFFIPEIVRRKVRRDCHITVGDSYYSVPYAYVGKIVDVHQAEKLIKISCEDKEVAVHTRAGAPGSFVTNESHYPKYKNFSHKSEAYRALYTEKMKEVGPEAEKIFALILQDKPEQWYGLAKGILSLKSVFSEAVINQACQRALAFKITSYKKIKNICESGSYNLPMERYEHTEN